MDKYCVNYGALLIGKVTSPVMGLEQAAQRFEKSSAKHSAQYGRSSLEVNL